MLLVALTGIMKSLLASLNPTSVLGTPKSSEEMRRKEKKKTLQSSRVLCTWLWVTQISPLGMKVVRFFPQAPLSALVALTCLQVSNWHCRNTLRKSFLTYTQTFKSIHPWSCLLCTFNPLKTIAKKQNFSFIFNMTSSSRCCVLTENVEWQIFSRSYGLVCLPAWCTIHWSPQVVFVFLL